MFFGVWASSPVDAQRATACVLGESSTPRRDGFLDEGRLFLSGPERAALREGMSTNQGDHGANQWANGRRGELGAGTPKNRGDEAAIAISGELRIDNREELLERLRPAPAGYARGEVSDARLLLAAYERWGPSCAEHVIGDFSFALWDARKRELLLCRDAMGTKPLYYSAAGGRLAFASRIAALLALPDLPRALDERMLVDYLGAFPEDETKTVFANVGRLEAGMSLLASQNGMRRFRHFELDPFRECCFASDDEYAEAFRDALRTAVKCRLRGVRRCGVLLSGGLDSSAVAVVAAAEAGSLAPLRTFSADFDVGTDSDERSYRDAVVVAAGTEHHGVRPDPATSAGDFSAVLGVFAQPVPVGAHWLVWPLVQAAAAEGVDVLLTGIDGDRVVSHGGGRYVELARRGDWRELAAECWALSGIGSAGKARLLAWAALRGRLPRAALHAVDGFEPRVRRRHALALRHLRRDCVLRTRLLERLRAASQGSFDARGAHVRALTAPDRVADVELLHPLGGALGVDVRHPFLDRRLVELCLSFPSSQKRRRGFDRYVARNALAALPDAVRWRRTKASFDRAFADWVVGWLAREPVDLRNLGDYVDLPRIAALFARVRRSPEPGAVDFVWRCVVLSRWLYTLGESSAVPSKSEPSSSGSNLAGRLRNEGLGGSPDGSAEPMRA